MRIVISSHRFHPDIGGIETVTALLAREWVAIGHSVEILTQSEGAPEWNGIPVWRRPNWRAVRDRVRKCDLYFQNNISWQTLWPVLDMGGKVTVLYQTYLCPIDRKPDMRVKIKFWSSRRLNNLAISQAISQHLGGGLAVVGNAYDERVFTRYPEISRAKDLVFVGRLVSDKGAHILLNALAWINMHAELNYRPHLTVVGSGPDEDALKALAKELQLERQIQFAGSQHGANLAQLLNEHKVMVVPSTWPEPFGIVALEGAACGCYVLGSDQGGLPDAIGPCGQLFQSENVSELGQKIVDALARSDTESDLLNNNPRRKAHLQKHQSSTFAGNLLERIMG